MKKGFTIAETVITVAILGVIAAVTIPVLNNSQPNKDIAMYNKALYTLQSATSQVAERSYEYTMEENKTRAEKKRYVANDHLANVSREKVCEELANVLNTEGRTNCNTWGRYTLPNFVTTDGLRIWDIGHSDGSIFTGDDDDSEGVWVDYELTEADKKRRLKLKYPNVENPVWNEAQDHLYFIIEADGKVWVPENRTYENYLINAAK